MSDVTPACLCSWDSSYWLINIITEDGVTYFGNTVFLMPAIAWENTRHLATLPLVPPPNDDVAKCPLFSQAMSATSETCSKN